MAFLAEGFSYSEYAAVHNMQSFGIAAMGAATAFLWLQLPNVSKGYRTVLTIAGVVTFISLYSYICLFNSWASAFQIYPEETTRFTYQVQLTGLPFDNSARYVDWLLTTPLLLTQLVLVLKLPDEETTTMCWKYGGAAVLMVLIGYMGELSLFPMTRWTCFLLAMVPFLYIIYSVAIGLAGIAAKQPESTKGMITAARLLTVVSWSVFPVIFVAKNLGASGPASIVQEQVWYTLADVASKAAFGLLIWSISVEKSSLEEAGRLMA